MNADEKIAKIISLIEDGATVYVTTMTRSTRIKKRDLDKFRKAGMELLKASGDSMYMANGRSYVCIDYCQITHTK